MFPLKTFCISPLMSVCPYKDAPPCVIYAHPHIHCPLFPTFRRISRQYVCFCGESLCGEGGFAEHM